MIVWIKSKSRPVLPDGLNFAIYRGNLICYMQLVFQCFLKNSRNIDFGFSCFLIEPSGERDISADCSVVVFALVFVIIDID